MVDVYAWSLYQKEMVVWRVFITDIYILSDKAVSVYQWSRHLEVEIK